MLNYAYAHIYLVTITQNYAGIIHQGLLGTSFQTKLALYISCACLPEMQSPLER